MMLSWFDGAGFAPQRQPRKRPLSPAQRADRDAKAAKKRKARAKIKAARRAARANR